MLLGTASSISILNFRARAISAKVTIFDGECFGASLINCGGYKTIIDDDVSRRWIIRSTKDCRLGHKWRSQVHYRKLGQRTIHLLADHIWLSVVLRPTINKSYWNPCSALGNRPLPLVKLNFNDVGFVESLIKVNSPWVICEGFGCNSFC